MTERPSLRDVLEHYDLEYPDRYGWGPMHCPDPAHDDDHMSCGVNLEEGVWRCHGCGAGGDAFTLIMVMEDLSYEAAVGRAEEIVGHSLSGVREAPFSGRKLSGGKGHYKPRFRRTAPARLRPFSRPPGP